MKRIPSPLASRASKYIEGLGLRAARPKPNPTVDFGRYKLSPEEGFVYSRVDGKTSYDQICAIGGLGERRTADILIKLKERKLILAEDEPIPKPRPAKLHTPAPTAPPERRGARAEGPDGAAPSILALLDDRSPVDPLLLAEAPALDEQLKLRLLRVHRKLAQLTPYQILGLAPGVDKKALKRGYFQASKEFHPDRYYGKDLGPYRQMLTDVFTHATRAFEALVALDDKKRAELDALLLKRAKAAGQRNR